MKKKLFLGAALALFLGAGIAAALHVTQVSERTSAMMLDNAEAIAASECINKLDNNNGDCTTDGNGNYFCESSWWIHDCVRQ